MCAADEKTYVNIVSEGDHLGKFAWRASARLELDDAGQAGRMLFDHLALLDDRHEAERVTGLDFQAVPDLRPCKLERGVCWVDWCGVRNVDLHGGCDYLWLLVSLAFILSAFADVICVTSGRNLIIATAAWGVVRTHIGLYTRLLH